jgi:hypothetical protein
MTYQEVLERVSMVEDVSVYEFSSGARIDLTVEDFDGFDEDWCEVFRDYDEEAVAELVEWLEEHAVEVEDDFYTVYHFEGFEVHLGYGSYDI